MSDEKLRSCPFCHSADVAIENACGSLMRVECNDCGAIGPAYATQRKFGKHWPREAAIRAWNGDVFKPE